MISSANSSKIQVIYNDIKSAREGRLLNRNYLMVPSYWNVFLTTTRREKIFNCLIYYAPFLQIPFIIDNHPPYILLIWFFNPNKRQCESHLN